MSTHLFWFRVEAAEAHAGSSGHRAGTSPGQDVPPSQGTLPCTLTLARTGTRQILTGTPLDVGGKQNIRRKCTQTWGECADTTQTIMDDKTK